MNTHSLAYEMLHELFKDTPLTAEQNERAFGITQRFVTRLTPRPYRVTIRRKAARLAAWAGIVAVVMGLSLGGVYLVAPRVPVAVPAVVVIVPVATAPSFTQELIDLGDDVLTHSIPTDMRTRFGSNIDITDVAQFEGRVFISLVMLTTQEHMVIAYEYDGTTWKYVGEYCQSCSIVRP